MRINKGNISLSFLIIGTWLVTIWRISINRSSFYLTDYLAEGESRNSLSEEQWTIVRKIVKGVRMLSPLFLKNRKCLMEALLVKESLKKRVIVTQFHLGAKKDSNNVSPHAWVSIGDQTIIGGPLKGYDEFFRIH
jgi:hypothetical protein